jgi:hypothetical protein
VLVPVTVASMRREAAGADPALEAAEGVIDDFGT